MSLSPVSRLCPPVTLKPKPSPVFRRRERTVLFVSTFRAKSEWRPMMRYELSRLARAARRQADCLACDIHSSPSDDSVFVIRSLWTHRNVWLASKGWEGHPAGIGLLDLCLLEPIKTTEEVPTTIGSEASYV